MGTAVRPLPVKLICGFIFCDEAALRQAQGLLSRAFGPVDCQGPAAAFDETDYYEKEMGKDLRRVFISFRRLIEATDLAPIKIKANAMEKKCALSACRRRVNIDPGYVGLSKLVLATTKNFSHRIYIGRGIYEEVTLVYKDRRFQPLAWTYPDYKTASRLAFFEKIRELYSRQLTERYDASQISRCI